MAPKCVPPKKNNKRKGTGGSSKPGKKAKTSGDTDTGGRRPQCQARTKKGTRCKLRAIAGSRYCHLPAHRAQDGDQDESDHDGDDGPKTPEDKTGGHPKTPGRPEKAGRKDSEKKKSQGSASTPPPKFILGGQKTSKHPPGGEPSDPEQKKIQENHQRRTEAQLEKAWDLYKRHLDRRREAVQTWKALTDSEYLHVRASAHHGIAIATTRQGRSSKRQTEESAQAALDAYEELKKETGVDYSDKIAEILSEHDNSTRNHHKGRNKDHRD
jgi:hypothetical protein